MSSLANTDQVTFPQGFLWGAATSSYQIEGSPTNAGGGPGVWDTFCQRPGAIRYGDSGDTACDHVNRFREDVGLMREMGLKAYRFSLSWPRLLPEGVGTPNEAGLAFYDALVDELLEANIDPWITLFHWDYPQVLYDRGGWLNPESVRWFADYTRLVVERLSDRVQNWFTINEPQVIIHLGLAEGIHAPGVKLSLEEQLLATHHLLLAHGRSVQVIREVAKTPPRIGWAPVGVTKSPACRRTSDAEAATVEAARQATMDICEPNLWNNTWYNDPVFFGHYPEEGLRTFGKSLPEFSADDFEIISTPIDLLGLNIYFSTPIEPDEGGGYREKDFPPGYPRTAFDWPVVEECLYWGARFHHERYQVPIYITENGLANIDWVAADGKVHDPQRIDYFTRHLSRLNQAISDGADVRGYFHWSLLDNFEWAEGYGKRFGLIHVDFNTQKRTPKESAAWYSEVIKANGLTDVRH